MVVVPGAFATMAVQRKISAIENIFPGIGIGPSSVSSRIILAKTLCLVLRSSKESSAYLVKVMIKFGTTCVGYNLFSMMELMPLDEKKSAVMPKF
jgi:hypothetical protein